MRKTVLLQASVCVLLLALFSQSAMAGNQPDKPSTDASGGGGGSSLVDQFAGSYKDSVPIVLPPFHGIEPNLSLGYDSSAGNGYVGVGWSLGGISTIERAGEHKGTPSYDNTKDTFLLNGEELIVCNSQPEKNRSPVCPLQEDDKSGTYTFSTKYESNQRVQLKDNEFYVWQPNGTKTTYRAIAKEGSDNYGSYIWAAHEVKDVNDNMVTYEWLDVDKVTTADSCKEAIGATYKRKYLRSIKYNEATATIYWEPRNDAERLADGKGLQHICARVRSIDVKFNRKRLNAYKFNYFNSQASGRTLLRNVESYGNRSFVNPNGFVTPDKDESNKWLTPPATAKFTWGSESSMWAKTPAWDTSDRNILAKYGFIGKFAPDLGTDEVVTNLLGNITGTGKEDLIQVRKYKSCSLLLKFVFRGTVTKPFAYDTDKDECVDDKKNNNRRWYANFAKAFLLGDIDANGDQEIIVPQGNQSTGMIRFGFLDYNSGNNTLSYRQTDETKSMENVANPHSWLSGDVNGDGRTDLIEVWYNSRGPSEAELTKVNIWTYNESSKSFDYATASINLGKWENDDIWQSADFNRDGRTDLAAIRKSGSSPDKLKIQFYLTNGTEFPELLKVEKTTTVGTSEDDRKDWYFGDFTGDGASDVVHMQSDSKCGTEEQGQGQFQIWVGTGKGLTEPVTQCTGAKVKDMKWGVGDFNGDGRSDLIASFIYYSDVDKKNYLGSYIYTSKGKSNKADNLFNGPRLNMKMSDEQKDEPSYLVGDLNADGLSDMAQVNNGKPKKDGDAGTTPTYYIYHNVGGGIDNDKNVSSATDQVVKRTGEVIETIETIGDKTIRKNIWTGSTTNIWYKSSASWLDRSSDTNFPPITQTVSKIQTDYQTYGQGTGSKSTTTEYKYEHPLYDFEDRRFKGFKKVTTTLPAISNSEDNGNPVVETEFDQSDASLAKVLTVAKKNGSGKYLGYTKNSYDNYGTGKDTSYKSLLMGTTNWDCVPISTLVELDDKNDDGTEKCKRTDMENKKFDGFGNPEDVIDYGGDGQNSGDETISHITYSYDKGSNYIVGLPTSTMVCKGKIYSVACFTPASGEKRVDNPKLLDVLSYSTIGYNSKGNPIQTASWLDSDGSFPKSTIEYNGDGTVKKETNPDGLTTEYKYDSFDRPTNVINAKGQEVKTTYNDSCSAPSTVTDLNSHVTTTTYDHLCRATKTNLPGGADVDAETDYTAFDTPTANNRFTRVKSVGPGTSGDLTLLSDSRIDGLGRVIFTASGPYEGKWREAATYYDARGGVEWAHATRLRDDMECNYDWSDDEPKPEARYCASKTLYDALGRPTEVETTGDGNKNKSAIDRTKPTEVKTEYFPRATKSYDENGRMQMNIFDAKGNVVEHREWRREVDDKDIDDDDNLTEEIGYPYVTKNTYDLMGRLVKTEAITKRKTNPSVTVYSYDSLGRLTERIDPDWGKTTYKYSAGGLKMSETDASNKETSYTYDLLGRVTSKNNSAGLACWYYDGSVNGVGRVQSVYDAKIKTECSYDLEANSKHFAYDERGNIDSEMYVIDGTFYEFVHSYDKAGRPLSTTYPDDSNHDGNADVIGPLEYDESGQLKKVPGVVNSIEYNAAGAPVTQENANETTTSTKYSPSKSWSVGISTAKGTTTIQDLSYSIDPTGKVMSVNSKDPFGSWKYGYDGLDQMTTARNFKTGTDTDPVKENSSTYSYDGFGNMIDREQNGVNTHYEYNEPGGVDGDGKPIVNHPHAVEKTSDGDGKVRDYNYDAVGRMTERAGQQITYNDDHLPVKIVNGDHVIEYSYDADGSRIKQTVDGRSTVYIGDDYQVDLHGEGGKDDTLTKYVSASGLTVAEIFSKPHDTYVSPRYIWLLSDRQGSIQKMTDKEGTVLGSQLYLPYGQVQQSDGEFKRESRGYTGQRHDRATALP